ncbi:hypothetical protein K504DRAFT_505634 [Pleomassaria siparia CBS 279.74]|uniref:Uncharacterized protein n=1 Tax=Pleomassaria siparia CBS 279.74 TaxID=1314801 RepID=A0A6G1JZJ9_9PLEO|nr:hypothetical protein K504DRAFT_505634 [Pleomassaria siparia CBS 279.74]
MAIVSRLAPQKGLIRTGSETCVTFSGHVKKPHSANQKQSTRSWPRERRRLDQPLNLRRIFSDGNIKEHHSPHMNPLSARKLPRLRNILRKLLVCIRPPRILTRIPYASHITGATLFSVSLLYTGVWTLDLDG